MHPINCSSPAQMSYKEAATFARLFAALDAEDPEALDAWLNDYRGAEYGTRGSEFVSPARQ